MLMLIKLYNKQSASPPLLTYEEFNFQLRAVYSAARSRRSF